MPKLTLTLYQSRLYPPPPPRPGTKNLVSALPAAGDDVLIKLEELLQDLDGALLGRNVSSRVSVLA
jgi:hypothetical protein